MNTLVTTNFWESEKEYLLHIVQNFENLKKIRPTDRQ